MADEDEKVIIRFAPGVLEQLEEEFSPEELQNFLDMLKTKAADGSLVDESQELDMEELEESNPDAFEQVVDAIDFVSSESAEDYKKKLN